MTENAKKCHLKLPIPWIWLQIHKFHEILVHKTLSIQSICYQETRQGYAKDFNRNALKEAIFSYPSTLHLSSSAHVLKIWQNMVLAGPYGCVGRSWTTYLKKIFFAWNLKLFIRTHCAVTIWPGTNGVTIGEHICTAFVDSDFTCQPLTSCESSKSYDELCDLPPWRSSWASRSWRVRRRWCRWRGGWRWGPSWPPGRTGWWAAAPKQFISI